MGGPAGTQLVRTPTISARAEPELRRLSPDTEERVTVVADIRSSPDLRTAATECCRERGALLTPARPARCSRRPALPIVRLLSPLARPLPLWINGIVPTMAESRPDTEQRKGR